MTASSDLAAQWAPSPAFVCDVTCLIESSPLQLETSLFLLCFAIRKLFFLSDEISYIQLNSPR